MATIDFRSTLGLLALQRLPRVGPTTALRAALRAQPPLPEVSDGELAGASDWAMGVLRRHEASGVKVVGFFDRRYPRLLSEISDPPPLLYVKGNLDLLESNRFVAVVGTRKPSRFGETAAEEITATLARAGWGIVSGLALGIDSIAHRTALECSTPTIAILGNGLDRVYPKANEQLADRIVAAGGALISELPFGAPPIPRNLIARDRLQSGISVAVVISQTAVKGGAMHTARFAAEQGRPLFCPVPRGENGMSEGLRVLLGRPARELSELIPAWRSARGLCMRLGSRPIAHPVERGSLDHLVDAVERALGRPTENDQQSLILPEVTSA